MKINTKKNIAQLKNHIKFHIFRHITIEFSLNELFYRQNHLIALRSCVTSLNMTNWIVISRF